MGDFQSFYTEGNTLLIGFLCGAKGNILRCFWFSQQKDSSQVLMHAFTSAVTRLRTTHESTYSLEILINVHVKS